MEILRSISDLSKLRGPIFLAIGVFDGVHRGHQAVISTSAEHAQSANGTPVVVTFDPHPMKVLRPSGGAPSAHCYATQDQIDPRPRRTAPARHQVRQVICRNGAGRLRATTGDEFKTTA